MLVVSADRSDAAICTAMAKFRGLIIHVGWYIDDDLKCDEAHITLRISSDGILYPIRLLAVVSLMEGGWEPHDLKVKAEAWVVISEFGMLHLEYVYPYRR